MSNIQAIYLYSAILVLVGTIRKSDINLSSPISQHLLLLSQVILSPLVLILSCLYNSNDFKEDGK
jgi:hypothetical protein